ncbi:hypothetical protein KFL_004310010, partial [Klebsormidium nitens]
MALSSQWHLWCLSWHLDAASHLASFATLLTHLDRESSQLAWSLIPQTRSFIELVWSLSTKLAKRPLFIGAQSLLRSFPSCIGCWFWTIPHRGHHFLGRHLQRWGSSRTWQGLGPMEGPSQIIEFVRRHDMRAPPTTGSASQSALRSRRLSSLLSTRSATLNLSLVAGGPRSSRRRELLLGPRQSASTAHLQGRESLRSGTLHGYLLNLQHKSDMTFAASTAASRQSMDCVEARRGGGLKFFCSVHGPQSGVFLLDKDRANWVEDRVQRRLKAEVVRLEEELQHMGEAPGSIAKPTACLPCYAPVWEEANFKVALAPTKPMCHSLLAILLMIGCVDSNPGPSSDGVSSEDSASASVLPSLQTRLSAGAPVESGGGELSMEDSRMEAAAEKGSPGQAIRFPPAQAESGAGDEDSSDSDASKVDLENKQDWDYEEEELEEPTSKDLDFLHDSETQEAVNPVVEYAQMNKEMGESDDELPPLVVKRRKRQDVAHRPSRRLRSRVDGHGNNSAGGASICHSSQATSDGGRAALTDSGQSVDDDVAARNDVAMEDQEVEETAGANGDEQNSIATASTDMDSVGSLLKHATTVYGQEWFRSKESPSGRGPRDLAVAWKDLHGHAILVASDGAPNSGVKMYTSFKDVPALVAYCNRLPARHQHLYECLLGEAPSLLYLDLDYYVPLTASADAGDYEEAVRVRDADFAERKRHFDRLRDGFLEAVLGVSEEAVRFEESTAHGSVPGGFKYSVHGVLKGFYLEDSRARSLFSKAFDHFLKNPPPSLARSAEFV